MSKSSDWQPAGVDVEIPSAARIYDYALGGAHNFASDRAAADALFRVLPEAPLVARSNRAFLQRAVRYCCGQGITQFLDLGSGIPTVGNVHEVAQQANPDCRVVYVDNESIAVEHTQELLADVPYAAMVRADIRDPDAVLGAPVTRRLLDFARPIGLMMVAVLHYVSAADDVNGIVARYVGALAPGSLLVVSHTTEDPRPDVNAAIKAVFAATSTPITHRSRAEVAALFEGLTLVDPGVVWTPQWHPADDGEPLYDNPEWSATFAAVGRVGDR
jgi:hypothetical protein